MPCSASNLLGLVARNLKMLLRCSAAKRLALAGELAGRSDAPPHRAGDGRVSRTPLTKSPLDRGGEGGGGDKPQPENGISSSSTFPHPVSRCWAGHPGRCLGEPPSPSPFTAFRSALLKSGKTRRSRTLEAEGHRTAAAPLHSVFLKLEGLVVEENHVSL